MQIRTDARLEKLQLLGDKPKYLDHKSFEWTRVYKAPRSSSHPHCYFWGSRCDQLCSLSQFTWSPHVLKTSVSRKAPLALTCACTCQHPFATTLINPREAAELKREMKTEINAVFCTLGMFPTIPAALWAVTTPCATWCSNYINTNSNCWASEEIWSIWMDLEHKRCRSGTIHTDITPFPMLPVKVLMPKDYWKTWLNATLTL